jgi:subtilase-type serine protease
METRISPSPIPMKTNLLYKPVFIVCTLALAAFSVAHGAEISSTWAGQTGDNWSDASKWNPAVVPNNSGSDAFNVLIDTGAEFFPGINLDIDVTLNSLTFTSDFSGVKTTDHSLTSAATSVGVNFPDEQYGGAVLEFDAIHTNVVANLGNLADFSGTTLNGGNYVAVAEATYADPGITSTIQFNGADVRTNSGDIQLAGIGSRFVDENGNDGLRHFEHNLLNGVLLLDTGRNFTTSGSMVNEGFFIVESQFAGAYGDTTLTISGDYTGIGYPLDPGTLGFALLLASGPIGDAKMVINGNLTNYDPATKTLNKTRYDWEAANGRSATTQLLGGSKPLDIVTSKASLTVFGPNTGFRDKFGNDALRNLAVSARFSLGDRDFATVGSFTSTSRLSIYGNSNFTVNGTLTIKGDQFQVFALTGYALTGEDGFPSDPPYKKSYINVVGNLNLASAARFRYGIYDNATLPRVTVGGTAILGGALIPYLLDGANVTSSDSFTLLTAHKINGKFSNVASGGRVDVISFSDGSTLGTALVTITKTSLILSDFQPAP